MKTNLKLAPQRAAGPKRISQQYLLKQLHRFPKRSRRAIVIVAKRHPALLDLAASFPALLYACTFLGRGEDRARLCNHVINGMPLRELSRAAGLPWWTRKLPPEAMGEELATLPCGDFAERHIINFIPTTVKDLTRWLELVSFAQGVAGDGFALWIAKNFDHCKTRETLELRSLGLWAWYSAKPESFAGGLVLRKWTPAISWSEADNAKGCWFESLQLFLYLGDRHVHYAAQTTPTFGVHSFVALTSAVEIFEECKKLKNCMRTYGGSIFDQSRRFISVRKDGRTVALLCLHEGKGQHSMNIEELAGPRNTGVSQVVAEDVRRWLLEQDPFLFKSVVGPFECGMSRMLWHRMWKPYWKGSHRPGWLPLSLDRDPFDRLRWDY
jgi:hypothetical protein